MVVKTRPLSPHLQIYRLPLVAVVSIIHRLSGVFLSIGSLSLAYWLLALAAGPEAYAGAQAVFGSWLGKTGLALWSMSLYFHLYNGIRHLFWDVGYGFALDTADRSANLVLIATALTCAVTWAIGFGFIGGAA